MSELFEEITINTMTLRNRSVRSATWAGMAEDGRCSMRLIELIADLAQGEVGLIITGFAYVNHILKTGAMDLVSMSRPLIREPGLVRRWKEGDRKKAKCISCNQCFQAARSPDGVYCVVERSVKVKKKG